MRIQDEPPDGRPLRAAARPDPAMWSDHEPMTLYEAAAVFFPDGPLNVRSLRTAITKGQLAVSRVAGKIFTTPSAIRAMTTPRIEAPTASRQMPGPPGKPPVSVSPTQRALKEALAGGGRRPTA
jgi:hypothetical protein